MCSLLTDRQHSQVTNPAACAQQAVPCSQPHPAFLWCQQKENSTTTNSGRYPSNLHDIQSLKECALQKDLVSWHEIKRINPRLFTKIKTTFKEARNPGGSKVFPSSSTFLTRARESQRGGHKLWTLFSFFAYTLC